MSIKRTIALATIACLGVTGLGTAAASASPTPKRHPASHVVSGQHKAPKRVDKRNPRELRLRHRFDRSRSRANRSYTHRSHTPRVTTHHRHPGLRRR